MPAHYSLRLAYGLHVERDQTTAEILDLCRATGADEIVLMIFAEAFNNGHETLEQLAEWLDHIRPWKQAVTAAGVAVSLNPWITMLHCDRSRALKPGQDWQRMVDWQGREASAVVCPLDPDWRTYYRNALDLYATERFRVIWLEDDIRLHNHAPLDWGGCFCPLHVAEFNRRTGEHATREQIVAAAIAPGEPHPWRHAWLDMWDDTMTAMVDEFRRVVEPYDVRLGLMSSGMMQHSMEGRRWRKWWEALGGSEPPIHRPHFTSYSDVPARTLPAAIQRLDMNREIEPPGTEIDPELENFPQGWSKSLRVTAGQMMVAQAMGSDRLYLSVYDYLGNPPADVPGVTRFLAGWKPTLDWVSGLFPATLRSHGIGCPWRDNAAARRHAPAGAASWQEGLFLPAEGWGPWLGGYGMAVQARLSDSINALAGDMAWAFDDAQIRWMLGRGLLLDGPASLILEERGFGAWLGLAGLRTVTQADTLYSIEELSHPDYSLRPGALVDINERPGFERLVQGSLIPGARRISVLRGPRHEDVGHGVVLYENDLGGRVALCPWQAGAFEPHNGQQNDYRQRQMQAVVDYLARGISLGRVSGAPYLVCHFRTDGAIWRGVIWNGYPDAVTEIRVELPAGVPAPAEVTQVDAAGMRYPAALEGDTIRLSRPLHEWECVVLG
jgi:hypothetical protein